MKIILLLLISNILILQDPVVVNGHVTKKGKFVKSHIRTKQDNTQKNNYSSKPNRNPYTGKKAKY